MTVTWSVSDRVLLCATNPERVVASREKRAVRGLPNGTTSHPCESNPHHLDWRRDDTESA
jgi:hypothetical protein